MKKLKLITSLSAVGALACVTPIITTSCSKNNKNNNEIVISESGTNCTYDKTNKVLTVTNVGKAASINIGITPEITGATFELDATTKPDWADITNGTTLSLTKDARTYEKGTELTIKRIGGKETLTINVIAPKKVKTTISEIVWYNEQYPEYSNPIVGMSSVMGYFTIRCDNKVIEHDQLISFENNGSDEKLEVEQTTIDEEESGGTIKVPSVAVKSDSTGTYKLKLKVKFYADETKDPTKIITSTIETDVKIVDVPKIRVIKANIGGAKTFGSYETLPYQIKTGNYINLEIEDKALSSAPTWVLTTNPTTTLEVGKDYSIEVDADNNNKATFTVLDNKNFKAETTYTLTAYTDSSKAQTIGTFVFSTHKEWLYAEFSNNGEPININFSEIPTQPIQLGYLELRDQYGDLIIGKTDENWETSKKAIFGAINLEWNIAEESTATDIPDAKANAATLIYDTDQGKWKVFLDNTLITTGPNGNFNSKTNGEFDVGINWDNEAAYILGDYAQINVTNATDNFVVYVSPSGTGYTFNKTQQGVKTLALDYSEKGSKGQVINVTATLGTKAETAPTLTLTNKDGTVTIKATEASGIYTFAIAEDKISAGEYKITGPGVDDLTFTIKVTPSEVTLTQLTKGTNVKITEDAVSAIKYTIPLNGDIKSGTFTMKASKTLTKKEATKDITATASYDGGGINKEFIGTYAANTGIFTFILPETLTQTSKAENLTIKVNNTNEVVKDYTTATIEVVAENVGPIITTACAGTNDGFAAIKANDPITDNQEITGTIMPNQGLVLNYSTVEGYTYKSMTINDGEVNLTEGTDYSVNSTEANKLSIDILSNAKFKASRTYTITVTFTNSASNINTTTTFTFKTPKLSIGQGIPGPTKWGDQTTAFNSGATILGVPEVNQILTVQINSGYTVKADFTDFNESGPAKKSLNRDTTGQGTDCFVPSLNKTGLQIKLGNTMGPNWFLSNETWNIWIFDTGGQFLGKFIFTNG